nr:hypothetical protein CFP56_40979 [Quercus suber]
MLLQCQPGSAMYNQLTKTLDLVGELNRVALDNVRAMASEASTQATTRGGRGGGSRGRGRSGGRGGGPNIHIDDLDDEALEADWDTYMDGAGSSRCTSDATAQASHPVGHDNSAEHTSHAQARPRSPLPTPLSPPLFSGSAHEGGCIFVPTPGLPTPAVVQAEPTQEPSLPNPDEPTAQIPPLSPPLFSGSAHEGGCIFVPTPGVPTPPVVQAEPTQEPSLPNPDQPAAQIEEIRSENIEPVHGLRRSLRTDIHPPGCGTGDGKMRPAKAAVRKRKDR